MHYILHRSRLFIALAGVIALLALLLAVVLQPLSSRAQNTPPPDAVRIEARDFAFSPPSATVALSEPVRWENSGATQHTVTSNDGRWNSGVLNSGASYTRSFTQTGTYSYYCALHTGMEGQITVVSQTTRAQNRYLPVVAAAFTPNGSPTQPITATGTRWSNPAAWGGSVPTAGAAVVIPAGTTMILDISPPPLASLRVDGTLVFSDTDLKLSANWIMVHGRFQVGSAQQPFRSKATITLTGNNKTEDIMGMGTKFLGTMGAGVIELHGWRRDAVSWTHLAATAAPGATQLRLAEPVDWRVGDEIVIAPSGTDPLEAEKVTVTSVASTTIGISPALRHRHDGTRQSVEGRMLDTRAAVGLLTRDIVVQGDDAGAPTGEYDFYRYTRGFGGHVMIMAGGQARVEGVEFRRMGQTGNKARYPMHWHFTGDGAGQYIKNSSVNGSFHRAIVTHGVSDVLVERNVVYNVPSHAFVPAEDGPEINNRFVGNLGVLNYQLNPDDYSFGPDGRGRGQQEERPGMFWLTNPNNPLIGNVAAGTLRGQGFFYDRGTFGAGFAFRNNSAHSITGAGSGNAELLYPPSTRGYGLMVQEVGAQEDAPPASYRFENFTAYKNGLAGVWLEQPHELLVDSILADHNLGGVVFESTLSNTLIINQATLNADDYQTNLGSAGVLYMTGRGNKLISLRDITFANLPATTPAISFNDDAMQAGGSVAGLRFVNTPQRISYITGEGRTPLYGWFSDADGSLSGTNSQRLIAPQQLDRHACTIAPALTAHVCMPPSGNALGLHLQLNETSGSSAADASGNGGNGTLTGSAAWSSGKLGGAVRLDGNDDWVALPRQRLQGDFTLALWINLEGSLERQNPIVGSKADGYYRLTFEPYSWGGTQYRGVLQLRNGNVNFNIAADKPIAAGNWNHIAIVRTGARVTLYLNGVAAGSGSTDDLVAFDALGRHENNYFNGALDDLRIYDRALSAIEVQTLASP
jgi:plastocyanin/3D (Asp-Asp-Asp) domain-containing protein